MTQHYGLTKLALLNTAGYTKCVIPLDQPASICAPNNTGKSSVINALQFPLINDLRLTEWDGHSIDETRKFYFGSDRSFVLLEANLPEGKVVIGVAGLGPASGYEHQFFTYQGALNLEDYFDDRKLKKYSKVFIDLNNQGLNPIELKPGELNSLLTGGATRYDGRINLRMVPLNNSSDAPIYKEIFRKILNLHNLSANDVKRFILRVFDRSISAGSIDFYEVWQSSFEQVNRARKQLELLESQQDAVESLEALRLKRAELKGKLSLLQPKLDIALTEWDEHIQTSKAEFDQQLIGLDRTQASLTDQNQLFTSQLSKIAIDQVDLERWFADYARLDQQFTLTSLSTLESRLRESRAEYDQLSHGIQGIKGQNLATIVSRRREIARQLKTQERQLKNIEYNLYSRIREDLSVNEVDTISRLFNQDVLSLATTAQGEVQVEDEHAFSQFIEQIAESIKGNQIVLPGATIDISDLSVPDMSSTEDKVALVQQIEALRHSLEELEVQEEIAKDLESKLAEREVLYEELKQNEKDLEQFKLYQAAVSQYDDQLSLREQLEEEKAIIELKQQDITVQSSQIADQRSQIRLKSEQLFRQQERMRSSSRRRIDDQFDLRHGYVIPYPEDIQIDMDSLSDTLDQFNEDCRELNLTNINIENSYKMVFNSGVTKFDVEEDEDTRLDKLISAFHNLDNEREAVERQSRVALTEVASTIKGLRQDLDRLKNEMNGFNRRVGKKHISNLKDFRIDIIERRHIVEAIDTILSTSESYEAGDTLSVFDLGLSENSEVSDLQLEEAKDYLIKAGSEKGGLTLSDLFDVRFKVVNRNDETEFFDRIDSAGSNGTRITIKLLCGMLFIRQLLAEKEQGLYKIPIYIDEAADIDPENQKSIIEMAVNFGFIPIFASVKPQTSCHYIVPIRTTKDGKLNLVDEKDWIECLHSKPDDENKEQTKEADLVT
ncbi:hypothetical protein [Litoribacillus peritrichatus]|uniref:Mks condensin complex protein MksF n=1 Tax=Litoribacillus peritrichatus TaxID=718191 RepID=A0ABP7LZQ9_9GAMM